MPSKKLTKQDILDIVADWLSSEESGTLTIKNGHKGGTNVGDLGPPSRSEFLGKGSVYEVLVEKTVSIGPVSSRTEP